MKNLLPMISFIILFIAGCSPEQSEFGEKTIEHMAMSEEVQTLFSEGRKEAILLDGYSAFICG